MPATKAEIRKILRELARISADLDGGIEIEIQDLEKAALKVQKDLADLIVRDVTARFSFGDSGIKRTKANISALGSIDRSFDKIASGSLGALISRLREGLIAIVEGLAGYFRFGFPGAKTERIAASNAAVFNVIGISADGKDLIPGGYLDRLLRAESLREQVRNFMTQAIVRETSLSDLTKGLEILVKGSPQADGFLQRYLRQYAYDSFNQIREVKNQQFAEGLGLHHFIYQGSLIKTSRAFCRKRAGKAFSFEETKTWKNDPDLIEKKTKESYNALVERGRYNCRHWLDLISEEQFLYLTGNDG